MVSGVNITNSCRRMPQQIRNCGGIDTSGVKLHRNGAKPSGWNRDQCFVSCNFVCSRFRKSLCRSNTWWHGGPTHWDKPQHALKLGESAIAELLSTQAETLGPVIKTAHEPNLLSNTKPHNRYLAVLEHVHLPSTSSNDLQNLQ